MSFHSFKPPLIFCCPQDWVLPSTVRFNFTLPTSSVPVWTISQSQLQNLSFLEYWQLCCGFKSFCNLFLCLKKTVSFIMWKLQLFFFKEWNCHFLLENCLTAYDRAIGYILRVLWSHFVVTYIMALSLLGYNFCILCLFSLIFNTILRRV